MSAIPPARMLVKASSEICTCCDEPIRFKRLIRTYYVRIRLATGPVCYHDGCYDRAGQPYGEPITHCWTQPKPRNPEADEDAETTELAQTN